MGLARMSAYLEQIAEQGVRVLSFVSFWKDAAYMRTVLVCLPLSSFEGELPQACT